jgi:hypothetical protein
MIVETDFLEHWKTRLLVRLLGTETAPLYVIRLWAHCQSRKTYRLTQMGSGLTQSKPDMLSAVCRWDGDPQIFWSAMVQTFVEDSEDGIVAHGWAEANASLVASWNNGKMGGRPKSEKPKDNPRVNPKQDPVIPQVTQGVTDREDKIEKSREEGEGKAPPTTPKQEELIPDPAPKVKRFVPPTREEANVYAVELGLPGSEVDNFMDFYGCKGWKVGKEKMVSWRMCLSRWARKWKSEAGQNGRPNPGASLVSVDSRASYEAYKDRMDPGLVD